MREREYNYTKECEWCGEIFMASASHARFCCPSHRVAAHKVQLKRTKQMERIKEKIAELLDDCNDAHVDTAIAEIQAYAARWKVHVIG